MPTILTCAVTGNLTMREQNPALPVTPEEIARSAVDAARAGASIVHLHARDPSTGRGTTRTEIFDEIVGRIRDADCDVILNLSTGEGGRFIPSDDDPKVAAPGSTLMRPELRVAHVERLKPDVCTLDFNTMYSGTAVVINTPRNLEIMAQRVLGAGVVPELEIFDSGDLQLALAFIERGILRGPLMWQIVLGVRYGAMADPQTMQYFVSRLPRDAQWTAFGIGRMAFPMLAQAFLLGGHVRIGMEDTVYIDKGVLAPSNAALVAKGVGIVTSLGGRIASVSEARSMLGLKRNVELARIN
ncbi:MAG TPA: 3-keto-5-aminohexanoate cleavage protein [Casimicrobiaceae bacterium]|nr:3-keto-5-aminohexanoate cleavage protein [Casimicrobiaceae bacterium]